MEDITKTGTVGLKGLKGINRKSTNDISDITFINNEGNVIDNSAIENRSDKYLKASTLDSSIANEGYMKSSTGDLGKSTYDKNLLTQEDLTRVAENRAEQQSALLKVTNGIAKGGILAATTFADATLGTIAGISNIIANNTNDNNKERNYLDEFINNPYSKFLQQINEDSESLIPNYYSKAEQEEPWYKNVFNANFLGDKVIKNMGFTVGAALAGTSTAGLTSKLINTSKYRNAFKGVASLGSNKVNPSNVISSINSGDIITDGTALIAELNKAGKQLKNAEWGVKTTSAITAALGEARIEAITNGEQYMESIKAPLEDRFNETYDRILQDEYQENPNNFSVVTEDGEEKLIPKDEDTYNRIEGKKQFVLEKYEEDLANLEANRAKMSNMTFLLNMAVLPSSNLYQWGKFLNGGYTAGKLNKGLVKGSLKEGFSVDKDIMKKGYLKATSNALMEAQEEMTQGLISETSGLYYGSQFNEFYGSKIAPDAEAESDSFINSLMQGFSNTYGDIDAWEEGVMGFITGLVGVPTFKFGKQSKNSVIGIGYENPFINDINEAKENKKEGDDLVKALNDRINSKEFLNYYQGMIRHNALQKRLDEHLLEGNEFEYKNVEQAQLLSDIMMFDKANRINDLYETIEEAFNITEEDIDTIKKETINKETGKSFFDNMTDSEIIEYIKKQTSDYKKEVDSYRDITNSLMSLYGEDLHEDVIQELTYNTSQINNLESRFNSIYKDITDLFTDYKTQTGKDLTYKDKSLIDYSSQELLNINNIEGFTEVIETKLNTLNKNLNNRLIDYKSKIEDLNKIHKYRKSLYSTFNSLAKNPELFSETNVALVNSIKEQKLLELKEGTEKLLIENPTLDNLESILNNNISNKSDILKALSLSENQEVKSIISNYKGKDSFITTSLSTVSKYPNINQNILDTLNAITSKFTTYGDAINELTKIAEEETNIDNKNIYNEIVSNLKAVDVLKSSVEKDTNKPKVNKKETKKKKGFSLSDVATTKEEVEKQLKKEKEEELKEKEELEKSNKKEEKINAPEELKKEEESTNNKPQEIKEENTVDKTVEEKESKEIEKKEEPEEIIDLNIEDNLNTILNALSSLSIEDLNELIEIRDKVLKGNKEDIDNVKKLAKKELENRKEGLNPTESTANEQEEINSKINDANKPFNNRFNSFTNTEYDINTLKEGKLVSRENEEVYLLRSLGVYEFVDKGYLGKLFKNNPNIKIHYILPNSSSVIGTRILLAVEVNEDFTNNNIQPSNTITVNGKQYQAVGTLGFDTKNQETMSEFLELKNKLTKESNGADYYTNPKYVTTINYIFSGRLATSTLDKNKVQRPLDKNLLDNTEYGFMFNYSDMNQKYVGMDESEAVPLNTYSNNPREGSLWLYSYGADGLMYPKSLKISRLSEVINTDSFLDSRLSERLAKNIYNLVDPTKSDTERALAKYAIQDILYISPEYTILFKDGNVSIKGYQDNIATGESLEDDFNSFINALTSKEINSRFQIKPSYLENESHLNEIINAEIITTDLVDYESHNASFTLNGLYNTSNNTVERVTYNTEQKKDKTVMLNGKYYTFDGTNYTTQKGSKISDKTKSEVTLARQVLDNEITPYTGSNNLFIGYYSTGEEFGIINNNVLNKKELKDAKDKADKKAEKDKKMNVPTNIDIQNIDALTPTNEGKVDTITESDVANFLNSENKKEEPKEVKTVKMVSDKFDSTINNALTNNTFNPTKSIVTYRAYMKEKGFTKPVEFIEFLKKEKGIDINSFTSKEELDNAMKKIIECI